MLKVFCLVGFLATVSTQGRAASLCSNVFNITSSSDGWWQGDIKLNTPTAITSWTMTVTLSLPVTSFVVYNSASTTADNKTFTLTSYLWSGTLAAGALLDTQFQVYYPAGTLSPDVIGVNFNGKEMCSGALTNTTTTLKPTTTTKPTSTSTTTTKPTTKGTTATTKQTTNATTTTKLLTTTTPPVTSTSKTTVPTTKSSTTTKATTNTTTATTTKLPTTVKPLTSTTATTTTKSTTKSSTTTKPTTISTTTKLTTTVKPLTTTTATTTVKTPSTTPGKASCSSVFTITSSWSGGWQGDVKLIAPFSVTSWTMVITLSIPVTTFTVYNSVYTTTDFKVFTLNSYSWSGTFSAGSLLDTQFQISYPAGTTIPDVIGVKFNGQDFCSGGSDNSTVTTTTSYPNGTTISLTTTTSKPVTTTFKQQTTTSTPGTTTPKSTSTTTPKRLGAKLQARSDGLYYNNQKVFLSGVNIAWNYYGYDFGNNQYNSAGPTLESWLTEIANNGGNSVRIWLHVEGDNTPQFDGNGYVTGPDRDGTLISDMRRFLDFAQSKNILVVFVLWNGALMRNQKVINLVWDDSKLQSYIDNALKPMASALSGHPALGAWEIVNEIEGSVRVPETNSNSCFDTRALDGSGAGWTGVSIPMERFLRFYNWQLAALREADPTTILTGGSWSEKSQTSSFSGTYNYYTNECLVAAGQKSSGTIDFYQMHTYAWQNRWNPSAPFNGQSASSYGLSKPLVIGEFATVCSAGESVEQLMEYAYVNGYAGAWTWSYSSEFGSDCGDTRATQNRGLNHLRGRTDHGVVNFQVS